MSTINERIAREAFGWTTETRKWYAGRENVSGLGFNTHLPMGHPDRKFSPHWFPVCDYDTNPADAMAVLKKCAEKCTVTVEFTAKNNLGNPQWMVARLESTGLKTVEDLCQCQPTLEAAICAFALKLFSPAAQAFNPDEK